MKRSTRRDLVWISFVAGVVTQVAPYFGIGDPEKRHLYIAPPAFVLLLTLDDRKSK